jgi:DNA-binding Lrp family transcriptional regulator
MTTWNFLTNHGLAVTYIGRHPECTGLEIAQAVGVTERAARKIVADLQVAGYIEREKVGRRNRYRVDTTLPLPYRGERAVTVGELLELLSRNDHEDDYEQVMESNGRVSGATLGAIREPAQTISSGR